MQPPGAIVVVGASLAGLRAVEELRRAGFAGTITLIGDETRLPYDRPPLSKQVLAGEWDPARVELLGPDRVAELDVSIRTGQAAIGLDLAGRRVLLDGDDIAYDGLIIATGARVRTLPRTAGMKGVFGLRTLDDAMALRGSLEAGPARVAVVGAGFIGAEVAATARQRGLEVTVVEALPQPLARVLGDEMGSVCADLHRDHGVELRLGVGVDRVLGEGHVEGLALADGTTVEATVVVVGIGVVPNTEWLADSGLTIDNGVVCDETGLAAPGVVAAGDVARWPNPAFGGELMRVEHWDNAVEQAGHVARRLLVADADAVPYAPIPYFWSDQYDRKIQLAGRPGPDDDVQVVVGSVAERRFVALYGRDGRLRAGLGMNRPRHVMQVRQLLVGGASWADALAWAESQR